jgi:PTH1 family peptidyl-tRNA hydrolase
MDPWFLIVGLGNPGREYARTRHNAGFLAVETLADRWRVGWSDEGRFVARVARADRDGRKVLLCQPRTFMNASGEAVAGIAGFYRVEPARLIVVADDADLPLGQVRLRPGGGTGGHHGLESIERHLGTREYARLKIGIGRTADGRREITGHVLGRFDPDERLRLDQVLARVADQVECWLADGIGRAMNRFNGTIDDPREERSE